MQLKPGTEGPPVFIAHGIGGDVLDFRLLASCIRSEHAILGLRAKGLDSADKPFHRIEDMAQYHLEAIKELQPHGPYLLVGYSLGGLIMLEIAQRLSASGEKVALLAMLDTYPHRRHLSQRQRLQLIARLMRHHLSAIRQLPIGGAFSYVVSRAGRRLRDSLPDPQVIHPTYDSDCWAWTRYRPRLYSGKVKFVKAEVSTYFPTDPFGVWARLVEELEVETVPGDHQEIISTQVENLAAVLTRNLREASDSR